MVMKMKGQIHMHTRTSDGLIVPQDVLESGLDFIAVTDHDALEGYDKFKHLEKKGIEVIPGVELSTRHMGENMHILVYYPEYGQEFVDAINKTSKRRKQRAYDIAKNLQKQGFYCPAEQFLHYKGTPSKGNVADEVFKHDYNKPLLEKAGVENHKQFIKKCISRGCPAYAPFDGEEFSYLSPLVKGIKVLAHPGHDLEYGKQDYIIEDLVKNHGVIGVEANSMKHSPEERAHYNKLADRLDLIVTTSADAHRPEQLTVNTIDYSVIEKMKEKKFALI